MSSRIPQQFIDDLIQRVDIVELINARVSLKKAGANFVACCPFHSEKTPSFTVSPKKQFYYCFGCGASGNIISFLMDYDRLSFLEAIEDLAMQNGLQLPHEAHAATAGKGLEALYELQARAAADYATQLNEHGQAPVARDYLLGRGINEVLRARYMLGYAPPGWHHLCAKFDPRRLLDAGLAIEKPNGGYYDRFRERIMFPIRDRRGRVVGFGGRVLDDSKPKYLNSPETELFHKGQEVYGLYELLQTVANPSRIVLVEGYMDVIGLARHQVNYAVATLGTAVSQHHFDLLFRVSSEIVLCFDGDDAGRRAAWKALEVALPSLRDNRRIRFMHLPDGKDPDDLIDELGTRAFEQRITEAQSFSDYFFSVLGAQFDLDQLEDRAHLMAKANPLIDKLAEGFLRDMMRSRLHELTRLPQVPTARKSSRIIPKNKNFSSDKEQKPSALRVVLGLLIQYPHLAAYAQEQAGDWARMQSPGGKLLFKLLQILNENPALEKGAAIVEKFRGQPEENYLNKLMRWEPLIPEDGIQAEFMDALSHLRKRLKDERLEELLQRAHNLSDAEKEEMKRLLNPRS